MRNSTRVWVTGCGALCALALTSSHGAAEPKVTVTAFIPVEASPELAPSEGFARALASDGTGWLVAYADANQGKLFLRRIGADGVPQGSPVPLTSNIAGQVSLAFDGTSFLASWVDGPNGPEDWHFRRVGTDGKLGDFVDVFHGSLRITSNVVLSGGEQSTLALIGGSTRIVTSEGVTDGAELTSGGSVVAYSDGTWLVVGGGQAGLSLVQIDGTGAVVDGTEKTIAGAIGYYPSVVATSDGFAVAWDDLKTVHVATVGFDGAMGPVADLTPPAGASLYSPRIKTIGGQHYVFATCYPCAAQNVAQRLDANFVPTGTLITDFPLAAVLAEPSRSGVFGLEQVDYVLEGSLLHSGQTITADTPHPVSIGLRTQNDLQGAPAPDGWLVAWKENIYGSQAPGALMATRLDETGAPSAPPFKLGQLRPSDYLLDLARGPNGWLFSIWDSNGPALELLPDGNAKLTFVAAAEWGLKLAASTAGWGGIGIKDNRSVLFYRVDENGTYVDKTTLATKDLNEGLYDCGVEVEGDDYLAWWTDSNRNGWTRRIPATGPIADALPTELPNGSYVWRRAAGTWWGTSFQQVSEGEQKYALDKSLWTGWGDLHAARGAAVFVSRPYPHQEDYVLGGLALGVSGVGATTIANAPWAFDPHFSQADGDRFLMLGYARAIPYNETKDQRAVVSVVELTGLDQSGGAGGEGGTSTGGTSGGIGGSESFAGAPQTGGVASVDDGGAATIPSDAGNGAVGGTITSNGGTGRGGRSGFGGNRPDDAINGGAADEGDDVTSPSDGAHGPRTSKGCGCRAAGSETDGSAAALPLLALGALALRRRRIIPS